MVLMATDGEPDKGGNGHRIVVTGGPGAGKTTAADLFRRELGERVVIVPEAATLLFGGGFPRHHDPDAVKAAQRAIYYVQRGLEDTQAAQYPGRVLICDRGTVDGSCYWPKDGDFFADVGSSLEEELARYDAVIFFETAAAGRLPIIEGGNPVRIEGLDEAIDLDRRLRRLWHHHPRFFYVPHHESFFKKLAFGLVSLEGVVAQLDDLIEEAPSAPGLEVDP